MIRIIIGVIAILSLIVPTVAQNLYEDDLYGSPQKKEKVVREKAPRTNNIDQGTSYGVYSDSGVEVANDDQDAEFVDGYDEALRRRINAYQSSREYPKEYWDLVEMRVKQLSAKYDQDLYNVIVINDQVWVEPIYVTAIFDDSDPTVGIDNYSKKTKKELDKSVNLTINVVNPWYSPLRIGSGYGSIYWNNYPYWGSSFYSSWGYYPPYWGGGYPSWGYYPPYWGGGFYPSWGYYPPYWGGGYYPPHWGQVHSSRPVYYGNTRYGGASGGNRNGDYVAGSGLRRSAPSVTGTRDFSTQRNVKVYDAIQRPSNGSNNTVTTRPGNLPNRGNQIVRQDNNFRRVDPVRTTRPEVQTRQPVQSQPVVSRPTYSPPVGGGGNSFGGGGGGGIRRSR